MQKLVLEICVGTSCHLLGSQDLIQMVENLPAEIKYKIDLQGATCLGACGKGPNIRVNGTVLSNMTPEQLKQIICDTI